MPAILARSTETLPSLGPGISQAANGSKFAEPVMTPSSN